MDNHNFQFGDQRNTDVKLLIMFSDGLEYSGGPVYFHSQVLKKSKYFEPRLPERWSADMSSFTEIKLTVPPNAVPQNYIKCINLMYSSYQSDISFSGVDETLDILPVALELLFDEGIQACMQYLEAVCWTPQQKPRIRALLSYLQVIKCGVSIEMRNSACTDLLWLFNLIRLCKRNVFEAVFRIFVDDKEIADNGRGASHGAP
ncbi:hypothetical protein KI387_039236 [Taxus chinensis]|uniref:BTB domain-containing protein n=1 Tax=Taxus chinensis TaxID=29808 RepID=A0AA38CBG4_TAXCH|nr:hypothetical protein KI387_039236 [Taxus chinensis]